MSYLKQEVKFSELIKEPMILLEISTAVNEPRFVEALLKSSIILSFAYWERFVEDILLEGCEFISEGLRNPSDLPKKTQEKIALFSVSENREKNPDEFTKSVWSFAGDGWSEQYMKFVHERIDRINTPSIQNVKTVCFEVFGIRNVFDGLSTDSMTNEELIELFDVFIEKRHRLAHGDSTALKNTTREEIKQWLNSELVFVNHLESMVWRQIAKITMESAKEYGLMSRYIYQIIEYFRRNGYKPVTNEVFQSISPTANSNYNKLGYLPWDLLDIRNPKEIFPKERLFAFIAGKLKLPSKIGVLKNQLAFPKEDADYLSYEDMLKHFQQN